MLGHWTSRIRYLSHYGAQKSRDNTVCMNGHIDDVQCKCYAVIDFSVEVAT